MANAIRGVLFDKDGTLVDFEKTWMPTMWAAARRHSGGDEDLARRMMRAGGLADDGESIRAGSVIAAGTNAELAALWSPLAPTGAFDELHDDLIQFLEREGAQNVAPIGDVRGLFGRLRDRGLKLGIATNDNESSARLMMDALGVTERLDFIAGYDSGHGCKPGPGMLRGFCAAVGLAADEVAMVGDNGHDMDMARAGGAGLAVAVLTGNGADADLAPIADVVIDSIDSLEPVLTG